MIKLQATGVFEKMIECDKRFIFSVGSSRSSKTYSTYQYIIWYCLLHQDEGKVISIIRRSYPSLRRSVMREFVKLLTDMGIYSHSIHNKTEGVINLWGNSVEFFSLDNDTKVRGSKRDVAYLNEVNEINYADANQIFLRTTDKIIMDCNPSDNLHWSWQYKTMPNSLYIHSTYKDNPFLEKSVVEQIEAYKDIDENWWRIYGLGLPGINEATIFTKWQEYKDLPTHIIDTSFGCDYGYNHASAVVKCHMTEDSLYFEEIIWDRHLTVDDLVKRICDLGITSVIWTDAARPDLIQSMQREGLAARGADKKVKEGIDYLKSKKIFIHENSVNLIKEIKNYKWKTAGDMILDEPVKINDDAVDAMRYAAFSGNKTKDLDIKSIFYRF